MVTIVTSGVIKRVEKVVTVIGGLFFIHEIAYSMLQIKLSFVWCICKMSASFIPEKQFQIFPYYRYYAECQQVQKAVICTQTILLTFDCTSLMSSGMECAVFLVVNIWPVLHMQ